MSQRDVAARTADLTPTGISRIERGERYPNLNTLEALAKVLRIEVTIDPLGTHVKTLGKES